MCSFGVLVRASRRRLGSVQFSGPVPTHLPYLLYSSKVLKRFVKHNWSIDVLKAHCGKILILFKNPILLLEFSIEESNLGRCSLRLLSFENNNLYFDISLYFDINQDVNLLLESLDVKMFSIWIHLLSQQPFWHQPVTQKRSLIKATTSLLGNGLMSKGLLW